MALVIAGSGLNCIIFLGALQYLEDSKKINFEKLQHFTGVSSGSLISYFLFLGFTPIELICMIIKYRKICNDYIQQYNLLSLLNIKKLDFETFSEIFIKEANEKLNKIAEYNPDIPLTFKTVNKLMNKTLVIGAYNYTKRKMEYLSERTHPDLEIHTAIKMSSAIPLVFNHCIVNEQHYIDGGFKDNFPIHIPTEEYGYSPKEVTGLCFNYNGLFPSIKINDKYKTFENEPHFQVYDIFNIISYSLVEHKADIAKKQGSTIIECSVIQDKKLDMNIHNLLNMVSKGYDCGSECIPCKKEIKIKKRKFRRKFKKR